MHQSTTHGDVKDRQSAEKEFFDKKVSNEAALQEEMAPEKSRFWLNILGLNNRLEGKEILECACGTGKFTVVLAKQAKHVESFDISPESVTITSQRAKMKGLKNVNVSVAAMESLPYEDDSFDYAVGLFILHHLADLENGIKQMFRVLRPGGKAVFYETHAGNPILMFWRKYLAGRWGIPKLGSADEHPLTKEHLETITEAFGGETIVSYPRFRFFGKLYFQLFRKVPFVEFIFRGLDNIIYYCLPFLRSYSYQVMVTLKK